MLIEFFLHVFHEVIEFIGKHVKLKRFAVFESVHKTRGIFKLILTDASMIYQIP